MIVSIAGVSQESSASRIHTICRTYMVRSVTVLKSPRQLLTCAAGSCSPPSRLLVCSLVRCSWKGVLNSLTLSSIALPIQSYTLRRQIVKNTNEKRSSDDTIPADKEATEAAGQSQTEEGLANLDTTLADKKDFVQNASDLEKGKG